MPRETEIPGINGRIRRSPIIGIVEGGEIRPVHKRPKSKFIRGGIDIGQMLISGTATQKDVDKWLKEDLSE